MKIWQIKLMVEETPDVLLLLKWIEEQEFEDLRYLLSEAEKERDDAEDEKRDAEKERDEMEQERDDALEKCDDLKEKLEAVEAIVNELKLLFV